jgi:hypothetical protein
MYSREARNVTSAPYACQACVHSVKAYRAARDNVRSRLRVYAIWDQMGNAAQIVTVSNGAKGPFAL